MIDTVADIAFITIESCILVFVANKVLLKRFHLSYTYALFVGVQIIRRFLVMGNWQSFVLTITLSVFSLLICYRRDLRKMASLLITYFTLSLCCEIIVSVTVSLFFGESYFEYPFMFYAAVATHKLLLLLSMFIFLKSAQKTFKLRAWLKYLPIPFCIFIVLHWFYMTSYENSETFGQMLAIGILGFLTCIFMIGYVQHKGEEKQLAERLKMTEEYEWFKKQYDEDLTVMTRHSGRMAHDSRHHFEFAASLPTIEDVREYAARILKMNSFNLQITGNHDIDAILYPKQQKAQEKGIGFTVSGLLPPKIDWFDPIDLVTILGNGLANAIDACEKIDAPDKNIHVAFRLDLHLDIRIDNPFNEVPVIKNNGLFRSSKKEPGHGIGMESIQAVVDRYDGYMKPVIENGVFSLRILLQNIKPPDITERQGLKTSRKGDK